MNLLGWVNKCKLRAYPKTILFLNDITALIAKIRESSTKFTEYHYSPKSGFGIGSR